MAEARSLALEALRRVRNSSGFRSLPLAEQQGLDHDLRRLEGALDPFAIQLDELPIPPGLLPNAVRPTPAAPPPEAPPVAPPPPKPTFGQQTGEALAAIDFPGFVAGLIHGVFQAIVDATSQQVREYAALVASLSRTVEQFTEDNVSPNQARDALVEQHPQDLMLVVPAPGRPEPPRIAVRPGREGTRPEWLADYGIDEDLTDELVEGALLQSARTRAGEERMQTLATLVLMGLNRVVVNDGNILAKLQFHASQTNKSKAELVGGSVATGIASRSNVPSASMMVSTSSANVQAEGGLRADLVGEVKVSFRTETFDLNNFANTDAIQLIGRHARWKGEATKAPAAAPAEEPK